MSCKNKKEPLQPKEQLNYTIETSDINHFWEAYDKLEKGVDSLQIIQTIFMDRGSNGYKEFLKLRKFKAKQYVDFIEHIPKFLKTVRPLTLKIKENKHQIDSVYEVFSQMYKPFEAPDICFAISPLMTGGTTNPDLILIGSEIACVNPDVVDISEITNFFKSIFENQTGDIKGLIAHELVHTQQPTGDNENESLLKQAIIEGSADFIASLIIGENRINLAIYEYGEAHKEELFADFFNDVKSDKKMSSTDWFYNYNSNRPANLGYYIGYEISKSFYDNSEDKRQAIKELIEMSDSEYIVKNSVYKDFLN